MNLIVTCQSLTSFSPGFLIKDLNVIVHPDLVIKASSQKHLGLILDDKLDFNEYIDKTIGKAKKGLGILNKCIPSYQEQHC